MSHIYEVKSADGAETREANELACDLIAKGTGEIKKRIPHAEGPMDAVEQVAQTIRNSFLDGLNRDVTVSIRPGEGTIYVDAAIEVPRTEGGVQ